MAFRNSDIKTVASQSRTASESSSPEHTPTPARNPVPEAASNGVDPSKNGTAAPSTADEPVWLRTTLAAEVSLLLAEHFGSVLHVQTAIADGRVQAVRRIHHENQFVDVRLDDESVGSISVRLNHVGKRAVITRSLHRNQEEVTRQEPLTA